MFWVYVLKCGDGSYYTGHTDDLEARVAQHQAGVRCAYTAKRIPVELKFAEDFQDRDTAFQRERQVKAWSRVKKEALFIRDWKAIGLAAIPPGERLLRGRSLDVARDERSVVETVRTTNPLTPSEVEGLDWARHT